MECGAGSPWRCVYFFLKDQTRRRRRLEKGHLSRDHSPAESTEAFYSKIRDERLGEAISYRASSIIGEMAYQLSLVIRRHLVLDVPNQSDSHFRRIIAS
jgi:hypothetical protein